MPTPVPCGEAHSCAGSVKGRGALWLSQRGVWEGVSLVFTVLSQLANRPRATAPRLLWAVAEKATTRNVPMTSGCHVSVYISRPVDMI